MSFATRKKHKHRNLWTTASHPSVLGNIKILIISLVLYAVAIKTQNLWFLANVEECVSEAEMSHWTDLMVFRQFYRQTASCMYRPDVLLRGFCSFQPTFSDDSGLPDAQICIFIVRDGPRTGRINFFCRAKYGKPGPRGRADYTTIHYTMTLDSVLLT